MERNTETLNCVLGHSLLDRLHRSGHKEDDAVERDLC